VILRSRARDRAFTGSPSPRYSALAADTKDVRPPVAGRSADEIDIDEISPRNRLAG